MSALDVVHWILVGSLIVLGLCSLLMFISGTTLPKPQRNYDWWALGMTFFAWIVPACHLIPGFW